MASIDSKPIDQIEKEDIDRLCKEKQEEGPQFELKEKVETLADGSFRPSALANIASEIVAFANSYGGTLIVGITESGRNSKRAGKVKALPDCEQLADRLKRSIHSVIDPPLPTLEERGVLTNKRGKRGIVVLRVERSRRRPHRLLTKDTQHSYVRRGDETVKIDMREIQDLTIRRLDEMGAIENEIAQRRETCRSDFGRFHPSLPAWGLQYIALPTGGLDLGRVVDRPELHAAETTVEISDGKGATDAKFDQAEWMRWTPALQSIGSTLVRDNYETRLSLNEEGMLELCAFGTREAGLRIDPDMLVSSMGLMLNWIDRVRCEGGHPDTEYMLEPMLLVRGDVELLEFGHYESSFRVPIPHGEHLFRKFSVRSRDDFDNTISEFVKDCWNLSQQVFRFGYKFHLQEWT